MNLLAIDPGYGNCAWVLLVNGHPQQWGGWMTDNSWSSLPVDVRCNRIARGLAGVVRAYDVTLFATERYFGGKTKQASIMNRGRFDLWMDLAMGHIPRYAVHPMHVKQWATGSSKAKKDEIVMAVESDLAERFPDFLESLQILKVVDREHVLEAYVIGRIAAHTEWVRLGYAHSMAASERELCERTLKDNPAEPFFMSPLILPSITGQE